MSEPFCFPQKILILKSGTRECTLGEDLYLRKNIFGNPFFNYQKIWTDILTIEKKVSYFFEKKFTKKGGCQNFGSFCKFFLHRIILNIWFQYEFFFTDFFNHPSHFSKNVSVSSHPRQNPILVCILPKIWLPCLLLSSSRNMKGKLAPLLKAGYGWFLAKLTQRLSRPLRVYLLLEWSVVGKNNLWELYSVNQILK